MTITPLKPPKNTLAAQVSLQKTSNGQLDQNYVIERWISAKPPLTEDENSENNSDVEEFFPAYSQPEQTLIEILDSDEENMYLSSQMASLDQVKIKTEPEDLEENAMPSGK